MEPLARARPVDQGTGTDCVSWEMGSMSGGTKTWGFSLPWDSSFTGAISCQLLCQIIVLVWQEVNISLYFCQRGGGRAVQESASGIKGLFLVPSEEREPSQIPGVLGTISWSHCGGKWQLTRQFNVSVLDEKCVPKERLYSISLVL